MLSLPFIASTPQNIKRPKVIVPFAPRTLDEARAGGEWAARARKAGADAMEWRVDALADSVDLLDADGSAAQALEEAQLAIQDQRELPVLITVRTAAEGGQADLDDAAYAKVVSGLIRRTQLTPPLGTQPRIAVDVEVDREPAAQLCKQAGELGVPVVASHHDFDRTPDTRILLAKIRDILLMGADAAKIAVMPKEPSDVSRLLEACASAVEVAEVPVIAISMGPLGRSTRVFGGDFGSAATFATLGDEPTAPGQIPVEKLRSVWTELY